MWAPVHTFTVQGTADEVQASIDAAAADFLPFTITVPWQHTSGLEDVAPGDGAVIELAAEGDATCWIGGITDVEFEPGYPMTVSIDVT
jgi:hypothetical protein